jgi:hypothetical protein
MAAIDKLRLIRKLEARGWKTVEGEYMLEPPEELFNNRPKTFYVYDAVDLHELLTPHEEVEDGE